MSALPAGDVLAPADFKRRFARAWDEAQQRFWKVERRQSYDQRGDPSFERWQSGDVAGAAEELAGQLTGQQQMYDQARDRGLDLLRLRLVERQLTPYLRTYEVPSYSVSERLGERVLIGPVGPSDDLPDCILFDSETLFINLYDGRGRPHGALVVEDRSAVSDIAERIAIQVEAAEPLDSFARRHDITLT